MHDVHLTINIKLIKLGINQNNKSYYFDLIDLIEYAYTFETMSLNQ